MIYFSKTGKPVSQFRFSGKGPKLVFFRKNGSFLIYVDHEGIHMSKIPKIKPRGFTCQKDFNRLIKNLNKKKNNKITENARRNGKPV